MSNKRGAFQTLINRFFKEPFHTKKTLASDINMYAYLVEANVFKHNIGETVKYIPLFFENYALFKQGKLDTEDLTHISVHTDGDYLKFFSQLCLQICINTGQYSTALTILNSIPYEKFSSDSEWMQKLLFQLVELIGSTCYEPFHKFVSSFGSEKKRVLFEALSEKLLFKRENADISTAFEKYGNICTEYYASGEESPSDDVGAGLIINSIASARRNKDYKLCISEMRRLINSYPKYTPIVSEYKKSLEDEISPPKHTEPNSFMSMAAALKRNIRAMINDGKYSEALRILDEYQTLCPDDEDIGTLRAEIKKACP